MIFWTLLERFISNASVNLLSPIPKNKVTPNENQTTQTHQ